MVILSFGCSSTFVFFFYNNYLILESRLIEKSISSAYDTVRRAHLPIFGASSGTSIDVMNTENASIHGSFIELPKELFQMLACSGPYLYRNTLLLQKVQLSISNVLDLSI